MPISQREIAIGPPPLATQAETLPADESLHLHARRPLPAAPTDVVLSVIRLAVLSSSINSVDVG